MFIPIVVIIVRFKIVLFLPLLDVYFFGFLMKANAARARPTTHRSPSVKHQEPGNSTKQLAAGRLSALPTFQKGDQMLLPNSSAKRTQRAQDVQLLKPSRSRQRKELLSARVPGCPPASWGGATRSPQSPHNNATKGIPGQRVSTFSTRVQAE